MTTTATTASPVNLRKPVSLKKAPRNAADLTPFATTPAAYRK